jgi:hypothetical protein
VVVAKSALIGKFHTVVCYEKQEVEIHRILGVTVDEKALGLRILVQFRRGSFNVISLASTGNIRFSYALQIIKMY